MKEFVLKEIGEDTLNEEYKTMLADITNSSLQKEFGEMFKEIIEKGEGKGVEWAKTNFVSFTADTSVEEESEMARLEGKIYFNVGKLEYFLNYDEIIWFENYGWYGVSIDRIDEKSKENDPEEMEVQVADSTMMMMDSVAAVMDTVKVIPEKSPVIKPSKNEKTPVKNNTVKPKNQMEAKKPE